MQLNGLFRILGATLPPCAVLLCVSPVAAGVTVRFDEAALNELLPALAAREIQVPLGASGSVAVRFDDLHVAGFDPVDGIDGPGYVRTALRAIVPSLGLSAPVEARLSLRVVPVGQLNLLRLRFEEVSLRMPMGGAVDLAPYVDPIDFPADSIYRLEGVQEGTQVRSKLSGVKMESHAIRFEFDLDVIRPGEDPRDP